MVAPSRKYSGSLCMVNGKMIDSSTIIKMDPEIMKLLLFWTQTHKTDNTKNELCVFVRLVDSLSRGKVLRLLGADDDSSINKINPCKHEDADEIETMLNSITSLKSRPVAFGFAPSFGLEEIFKKCGVKDVLIHNNTVNNFNNVSIMPGNNNTTTFSPVPVDQKSSPTLDERIISTVFQSSFDAFKIEIRDMIKRLLLSTTSCQSCKRKEVEEVIHDKGKHVKKRPKPQKESKGKAQKKKDTYKRPPKKNNQNKLSSNEGQEEDVDSSSGEDPNLVTSPDSDDK